MEILLKQPYSFCQIGKRGNQEDSRFPDDDTPNGCPPVFVVCDGVGGQDKGEVASRVVADAIGEYLGNLDLTKPFKAKDFSKVLDTAYNKLEKAMSRETRDMATTLTLVAFHGGGALCAHMGDSRIYHVRQGVGILYRSNDHSLVNELVHSGNLTPEEAVDHPRSNVITRCLCHINQDEERPGATVVQIRDIQKDDYFFLCSDGVNHCINDNELFKILNSSSSDQDKISIIAEKSSKSSDNNTAYMIAVKEIIRSEEEKEELEIPEERSAVTSPIKTNVEIAEEIYPENLKNRTLSNFFKNLFK